MTVPRSIKTFRRALPRSPKTTKAGQHLRRQHRGLKGLSLIIKTVSDAQIPV